MTRTPTIDPSDAHETTTVLIGAVNAAHTLRHVDEILPAVLAVAWRSMDAFTPLIGADAAPASRPLANTAFAVFGLGDSNYWPRKEQRIFFNKPSVDLDAALAALGGAGVDP